MISSHPFPVFLSLAGARCVVIGLGDVGARKADNLLACDVGELLVLDWRPPESLSPASRRILKESRVTFARRGFADADAEDALLVFAATSDPDENLRITEICKKRHVLCNCVTDPEIGDFILPATARQGALCAALSTSGQSPLLARQWRLELENWLKPREKLAWLLGRLRGPILALGREQAYNSLIFRRIAESPIPHWLEHDEIAHCREWLEAELPGSMQPEINEIFTEYASIFA